MGVITDKLGADLKQQKDIHTFLENNKDKLSKRIKVINSNYFSAKKFNKIRCYQKIWSTCNLCL